MNPELEKEFREYAYSMEKYALEEDEIEICVDYDEDWSTPKVKEKPFSYDSMLTSVMEHLEVVGGVEFAILKDPELGRWWAKKVKKRNHEKTLNAAKEKLYSTMSKEELKILGIKLK